MSGSKNGKRREVERSESIMTVGDVIDLIPDGSLVSINIMAQTSANKDDYVRWSAMADAGRLKTDLKEDERKWTVRKIKSTDDVIHIYCDQKMKIGLFSK